MATCVLQPGSLNSTSFSLSQILANRRDFVADELERLCAAIAAPRILSVNNGSLREASAVLPLCRSRGGRFVAMDTDEERLAALRAEYGTDCFECSPGEVLGSSFELPGAFHFIYALNLLPGLNENDAAAVISRLASLLNPGGTLLLTSFTRDARDLEWRGHCPPYLRDEQDLTNLAVKLWTERPNGSQSPVGHATWRDVSGVVAYLEIAY